MRNTTKLKAVLKDYIVDLSMNEDEKIVMTLFSKHNEESESFENKSYSILIAKAYSYANKQKKLISNPTGINQVEN